jgi:FixJ family two-component response regulator
VSEATPIVFVVDDDESMRIGLRNLLTSVGLQVEVFPTAGAFLDSPRPNAPACLLLDVRLPDLNGLELQKRLALSGRPVPIVFLTGHGDIPMTVRAMKAGAIEFLTKPFRERELIAAVHHAFDTDRKAGAAQNPDPSKVG